MPPARLVENTRRWAAATPRSDPHVFERLARQQNPEFLWIGCSDSRVPANVVVDVDPGEVFVHRNVANLVVDSDLNLLSVLQFAVDVLRVRHVIVCGHYGCGGVRAALRSAELGLIDYWLKPIKQMRAAHRAELDALADDDARADRLCELNVRQQVTNVASTTIVQRAWAGGQDLRVHGLVYGLRDGLLRDLQCSIGDPEQLDPALRIVSGPEGG